MEPSYFNNLVHNANVCPIRMHRLMLQLGLSTVTHFALGGRIRKILVGWGGWTHSDNLL